MLPLAGVLLVSLLKEVRATVLVPVVRVQCLYFYLYYLSIYVFYLSIDVLSMLSIYLSMLSIYF